MISVMNMMNGSHMGTPVAGTVPKLTQSPTGGMPQNPFAFGAHFDATKAAYCKASTGFWANSHPFAAAASLASAVCSEEGNNGTNDNSDVKPSGGVGGGAASNERTTPPSLNVSSYGSLTQPHMFNTSAMPHHSHPYYAAGYDWSSMQQRQMAHNFSAAAAIASSSFPQVSLPGAIGSLSAIATSSSNSDSSLNTNNNASSSNANASANNNPSTPETAASSSSAQDQQANNTNSSSAAVRKTTGFISPTTNGPYGFDMMNPMCASDLYGSAGLQAAAAAAAHPWTYGYQQYPFAAAYQTPMVDMSSFAKIRHRQEWDGTIVQTTHE
uniref:Uncharacterized protein n=1 Tax=Acrobeloides nanus TaxID=290746 RepID=A0A914EJU6_9BILA